MSVWVVGERICRFLCGVWETVVVKWGIHWSLFFLVNGLSGLTK